MKFEEWLSQQGGLIEVDCGCVTTEAFYHWLRAAYESGALTNEGTIQSGNSAQPVTVPDECINAAYEKHLYGIMSGTGNKRAAVDFLNECLAAIVKTAKGV